MFNLLKVELHKLKTYKLFYFMIFLGVLQAVVLVGFSDIFLAESKESMLNIAFNTQEGLPSIIFIGVFVGDYIVKEFTSGYIKNLITYGHKRCNIFIAKSLVIFLAVMVFSLTGPTILFIRSFVVSTYTNSFTLESIMFLIKFIIIILFVQSARVAISILYSVLFRNSYTTVISLILGMYFINIIVGFISTKISFVKKIYSNSIYNRMLQTIQHNIPLAELLNIILFCLVITIICTSLSIYVFERVDIK